MLFAIVLMDVYVYTHTHIYIHIHKYVIYKGVLYLFEAPRSKVLLLKGHKGIESGSFPSPESHSKMNVGF